MHLKTFTLIVFLTIVMAGKIIAQSSVQGFVFPQDRKVPVSMTKPNTSPETFRFAVIADRTGGMMDTMFNKGIDRLNLLQPEFVISIGDIIDGYTEEEKVWNQQWDEIEEVIGRLKAPFFYLPGNHDISNALLDSVWKARLGAPYYYFLYKDVLFLMLNTEDPHALQNGITKEQSDYFVEILKKHQDVRFTFVFMHRPFWRYGNRQGYEPVEEMLKGRDFMLFSGHHHHYVKSVKDNAIHYVMATTGGGSYLRGPEFGEMEHVMWVTMTPDGPVVANLDIHGIYPDDIVVEENYELIQALRMGGFFEVKPLIAEHEHLESATTTITFNNVANTTLFVSGELRPAHGVRFHPETIEMEISPRSKIDIDLQIVSQSGNPVSLHQLNEDGLSIELDAGYEIDGKILSLPSRYRISFDHKHPLLNSGNRNRVDAYLGEWNQDSFLDVRNPMYFDEGWDWNGPDDGWFRFATARDRKYIYVAIESFDDKLIIPSIHERHDRQDQFFIQIDPKPGAADKPVLPNRLYGREMVSSDHHLQIIVAPGADPLNPIVETNDQKINIKAALRVDPLNNRMTVEVAVPIDYITNIQGKDWSDIRINIGWMDHDRPENTKPSVLWWRPVWGKNQDQPGFGVFKQEK
jgi:hypothetical protein